MFAVASPSSFFWFPYNIVRTILFDPRDFLGEIFSFLYDIFTYPI